MRKLHLMVATLAMLTRSASAQGALPARRATLQSGTLSFVAHSSVGEFTGTTSTVWGEVAGDVRHARGWIEALVVTLTTQNGLRDRDLRESLEAESYPTMRFDMDSVTVLWTRGDAPDSAEVLLHGSLAIHGVSREVVLPASVARTGDVARVTAAFPLDLTEYKIEGLTKFFGLLRVQREIQVRIDLCFARATGP